MTDEKVLLKWSSKNKAQKKERGREEMERSNRYLVVSADYVPGTEKAPDTRYLTVCSQ